MDTAIDTSDFFYLGEATSSDSFCLHMSNAVVRLVYLLSNYSRRLRSTTEWEKKAESF